MLINVTSKELLPFEELSRLVLKFVYEPDHMNINDIRKMQDSIVAWHKKLESKRWMVEIFGGRLEEQSEFIALTRMAWMLRENEQGHFDQRKKLFRDKGIDWRRFHRLSEFYEPKDFEEGKRLGEESDKREGIK